MPLPHALIIEPNEELSAPFTHLAGKYSLDRCASIEKGLQLMAAKHPDVVLLSASFSPSKSLKVLESLKHLSMYGLIPLVLVVDLSHRLSTIPGTEWGNKFGILCTLSSAKETHSTMDRVMLA